jgi:hypothetical protein
MGIYWNPKTCQMIRQMKLELKKYWAVGREEEGLM